MSIASTECHSQLSKHYIQYSRNNSRTHANAQQYKKCRQTQQALRSKPNYNCVGSGLCSSKEAQDIIIRAADRFLQIQKCTLQLQNMIKNTTETIQTHTRMHKQYNNTDKHDRHSEISSTTFGRSKRESDNI